MESPNLKLKQVRQVNYHDMQVLSDEDFLVEYRRYGESSFQWDCMGEWVTEHDDRRIEILERLFQEWIQAGSP